MAQRTISRFAAEMGVPVDTVRYYERRGLLSPMDRTAAGYRTYGSAQRDRLSFILRAKALGFTLAEVSDLLGSGADLPGDAGEVRRAATDKLQAVEAQRLELVELTDRLQRLVQLCDAGDEVGCLTLRSAGGA